MPEYEMTLVDQQRIARDTMAFWFDTNGASLGFRAGQHADFVFKHPPHGRCKRQFPDLITRELSS